MKIMACFRMLQVNPLVLDGSEKPFYVCIISSPSLSIHGNFHRLKTFDIVHIIIRSELATLV